MNSFFVTGGTLKPDSPSYIVRAADDELFESVMLGEYCTVLTTRQMGKSSLMARTAVRLRQQGVACAIVDLQGKGEQNPPPDQWYYGVVKQTADGLGLAPRWSEWWKGQDQLLPAQRLTDFFADVALQEVPGRVVVFIDEVDWMIRLPFSDEFFAAIRSCFNRRATDGEFDRLSFVLLGSAAPAQLIKDATRTPFNVGRGIQLTDFRPEETRFLGSHLGSQGEALLSRIMYWTDGHPYLTQSLCAKVSETPAGENPEARVDALVRDKLLSANARLEENNLKFVADRLTHVDDLSRVLRLYRDVLRGKSVPDEPVSPTYSALRLTGVVKTNDERNLQVRNRIYGTVFDESWVKRRLPSQTKSILLAAVALLVVAYLLWPEPTTPLSVLQSEWIARLTPGLLQLRDPEGAGAAAVAAGQEIVDPWTAAQIVNGILRASVASPAQTDVHDIFDAVERMRASGPDGSAGWVGGGPWPRTEVSAWIGLSYMAALRSGKVWPPADAGRAAEGTLQILTEIADRQNPETRGWGPTKLHAPKSDRTYSTVFALWSLLEARHTPVLQNLVQHRFDEPIRSGIDALVHQPHEGGWVASGPGSGRYKGLTALAVYVLSLASTEKDVWNAGDMEIFVEARSKFLALCRESPPSYHDIEPMYPGDETFRDDHNNLIGPFNVTFFPFPWSLAAVSRIAEDPTVDPEQRKAAAQVRERLLRQLGKKESNQFFQRAALFILAENLVGLGSATGGEQ